MANNALPTFFFDNIATRRTTAGVFVIPDANIIVNDTKVGDYNKNFLRDGRKFTRWKSRDTVGTKTITYDYGSNVSADTLIVFGHNLSGKTVLLESAADGGGYSTRVSAFVPTDNLLILRQWVSVAHRTWRLSLSGLGTTEPEIGELYIGSGLTFPLYLGAGFDPRPYDPQSQGSSSVEGHPLGVAVDYIKLAWVLDFFPVSNTFVDAVGYGSFTDFRDRCDKRREPFYFGWDITNHLAEIYMVSVPLGKQIETPYDRNVRRVRIPLVGKTEDFEL